MIALVNPALDIHYVAYKDAYGHDFEDVRRRVPDVSRLEQTLGFKPRMSLTEILQDTIDWKRNQL
ncbi:MAG: hypothetical protein R3C12_12435 [Planctomycetaceae bacterium]